MSDAGSKSDVAESRDLRGVLSAGTRLRNYEIVSVLGQGSFGVTYRARDATLGRDVAIKEYLPTSLALREGTMTVLPRSTDLADEFVRGRDLFLEEARLLARLDEVRAVIRVHDFLEANGTAYMVMTLARGETLERRLRRDGALSSPEVERILQQLLNGLEEFHGVGLLHRDIKPANIILDDIGNPTLIDFGAARMSLADSTAPLTAIFTPGYAAAEQFTSGKQGPWTDIYGLAATLYHAIVGKVPPSAFERVLDDDYEPLDRIAPKGFAPALLAGIDAALAVRAADRPQSISDWRKLFGNDDAAVQTHIMPRSPASIRPAEGAQRLPLRRRLALWAGVAASALVVLAGGIFFVVRILAPTQVAFDPLAAPTSAPIQVAQAHLTFRSGHSCAKDVGYFVNVYSDKVVIQFNDGWHSFAPNAVGDYVGTFTNRISGRKFKMSGNLEARTITSEDQTSGCVWSGSF